MFVFVLSPAHFFVACVTALTGKDTRAEKCLFIDSTNEIKQAGIQSVHHFFINTDIHHALLPLTCGSVKPIAACCIKHMKLNLFTH